MSIQQEIDDGANDPDQRIGSIVVTGGSGSFKLAKGLRVVLRNCDSATCESNEGDNEVNFVNCNNASVMGFSDGVIRFEQCDQIGQVETTGKTVLHVGGATIQELMLTDTQGIIAGCTVQEATLKQCSLVSKDNMYQVLNVQQTSLHSDNDQAQDLVISQKSKVNADGLQSETFSLLDNSILTVQNGQTQQFTMIDSTLTDINGQFQQATCQGNSFVTFIKSQIQGELTATNIAGLCLDGAMCQAEFTAMQCTITARKAQFQAEVSVTNCPSVFADSTFQGQFTAQQSAVRFLNAQCQGEVTFTDGSFASERGQFQGAATFTNGTIESINDAFTGEVNGTGLKAYNKFWNTQNVEQMTLESIGEGAFLEFDMVEALVDLSITGFAKVNMSGLDTENCTMMGIAFLHMDNSTISGSLTLTSVSTAILDNSEIETCTCSAVGTFIAPTTTIQTLTNSNGCLSVTNLVSTGTMSNVIVIDTASTLTTNNCTLITSASTITDTSSVIIATGGTVTGTNSVVTTNGGEVTNPTGLTSGMGFDPTASGGSVLMGESLTIQCTIGDININASGDVNLNDGV